MNKKTVSLDKQATTLTIGILTDATYKQTPNIQHPAYPVLGQVGQAYYAFSCRRVENSRVFDRWCVALRIFVVSPSVAFRIRKYSLSEGEHSFIYLS